MDGEAKLGSATYDVEDAFEVLERRGEEGRRGRDDPRVRDDEVEGAEALDGRGDCPDAVRCDGDVAAERERHALGQSRDGVTRTIRVEVEDRHPRAPFHHRLGGREADALGAAGDKARASLQGVVSHGGHLSTGELGVGPVLSVPFGKTSNRESRYRRADGRRA